MPGALLGVDVGTTGIKVTVLDPESGRSLSRSSPSPLYSDHPGWSEADTSIWWTRTCELIPVVLDEADIDPASVLGIASTGMVPAVVLLDDSGKVLRRAMLQNDARAVVEISEISNELEAAGIDVLSDTGSAMTQQSVAPTWRWLLRHESEVARATGTIVGSYDWLAIALGAERHIEWNWALESGLFEISGELAHGVVEVARLDANLIPPVRQPGSAVGFVSEQAARETTLVAGTPIYVAGADHVLAGYAAGLSNPGDWLVKLGGGGDILVVAAHPIVDSRWYLDAHPQPGLWLPNGCMATSGSLLRWMQQVLGGVELEVLDEEGHRSRPGEIICLPYFLGEKSPLNDPDLRGAFVGLHLGHDRGDLFRSCLEGVAYGFRNHVDAFASRGVVLNQEPRVSNGGAHSTLWKQIIADVLQVELIPVVDHEGASFGAALCAGIGAGALSGWKDGSRYVHFGDPVPPRRMNKSIYDEGYEMYLTLQKELTPISHILAGRGAR
jgi:xylulokinase